MRDALGNIRLAFVEIKSRAAAPSRAGRSPAEAAERGVDDPPVAHRHALGTQQAGLAGRPGSVTSRPSLRTTRHHGTSTVGRRRAAAPTARDRPWVPGDLGDVAVADDLAVAERHEHADDALARTRSSRTVAVRRLRRAELDHQVERRPGGRRRSCGCRRRSRRSGTGSASPSSVSTWPSPTCSSKSMTVPARHQWTILAIGISSRSVAPASLSAGMTRLIRRFSTSALDGEAAAGELGDGRRLGRRQHGEHRLEVLGGDVELEQHLRRAPRARR